VTGWGRLVALGAVVVDEAALDPWAERFRGLCRRLKVPNGTEVKWSPPKSNWLRGDGATIRQELFERMLQLAIDHEIRSIVVIVDQDQVNWSEETTRRGCSSTCTSGCRCTWRASTRSAS
jgi:hypothetical protein